MSTHNLNYITGIPADFTDRMTKVRQAFITLESEIEDQLPHTRESSLAWTNLEQALMWAIKSLCIESQKNVSDFNFEPVRKE